MLAASCSCELCDHTSDWLHPRALCTRARRCELLALSSVIWWPLWSQALCMASCKFILKDEFHDWTNCFVVSLGQPEGQGGGGNSEKWDIGFEDRSDKVSDQRLRWTFRALSRFLCLPRPRNRWDNSLQTWHPICLYRSSNSKIISYLRASLTYSFKDYGRSCTL